MRINGFIIVNDDSETDNMLKKNTPIVINFPVKQIASMMSECLILGAVDGAHVTLLSTLGQTVNGLKIG